jgi:hypothetical protein
MVGYFAGLSVIAHTGNITFPIDPIHCDNFLYRSIETQNETGFIIVASNNRADQRENTAVLHQNRKNIARSIYTVETKSRSS